MTKAIIFDYDGVIVDSFVSVFEVYKKICQHFNLACPQNIEEFRKTYGYSYYECQKDLGVADKDFPEASRIYKEEIVKMNHELFPGISEVIEELSRKYKIYLVSASHSDEVLPRLEKFGLKNLFTKIYCGADQMGVRKSELILRLLSENNYSADEVVSIGDRAIDYEVAQKAGIKDENVILVTYGWGLDKSRIGKVNIADSPADILKYIK